MRSRLLASLLIPLVLGGCSEPVATPKGAAAEINDMALSEFIDFYLTYSTSQKAPPKSIQDLEGQQVGYPLAYQGIVDKTIIVDGWGVPLTDLSGKPGAVKSDQVLAHQAKAPTEGGLALLLDCRIVEMTADEFKAAPKAGTTSP